MHQPLLILVTWELSRDVIGIRILGMENQQGCAELGGALISHQQYVEKRFQGIQAVRLVMLILM